MRCAPMPLYRTNREQQGFHKHEKVYVIIQFLIQNMPQKIIYYTEVEIFRDN